MEGLIFGILRYFRKGGGMYCPGTHARNRLRAVSPFSVVRRAKRETRKWPRA